MWTTLPVNTSLFRMTRTEEPWTNVLAGLGSYYGNTARYNTVNQATVYASEDPWVAISEWAWHTTLKYCEELGSGQPSHFLPMTYPLVESGRLWEFKILSPIQLIDVTQSVTVHQFGYPAHMPANPHPNHYVATQHLANQVRAHIPKAPQPRAEGIIAQSLRTTRSATYMPRQVVLFVYPAPTVVPTSLQHRANHVADWLIELEHTTAFTNRPTTRLDPDIAWLSPQFRVSGSDRISIPKSLGRPRGQPLRLNTWKTLPLHYSPY